jgi:hypothetical protein
MASPFQLHVLALTWLDLKPRYRMQDVWTQLAQVDLGEAPFVFTDADLRAYDWDHQEIWLNEGAMTRIARTQADRLLLDPIGRAFVVTLDRERLYGGVFYYEGGAAGIQFPVIHALGQPIEFLRIRPALGSGWTPQEPHLATQCQAIANPRLADWLAQEELIRPIPAAKRPRDPWATDL